MKNKDGLYLDGKFLPHHQPLELINGKRSFLLDMVKGVVKGEFTPEGAVNFIYLFWDVVMEELIRYRRYKEEKMEETVRSKYLEEENVKITEEKTLC